MKLEQMEKEKSEYDCSEDALSFSLLKSAVAVINILPFS
jgi:hypothetical protein